MIKINIYIERDDINLSIDFPKQGEYYSNFIKRLEKEKIKIPKKIQLIRDDSELKDNYLQFSDNDSIILRDISKQENYAINFADISPENMIEEEILCNDYVPNYLTLNPGINLIGECDNKKCNANNKMVISHIKEDNYNMNQNKGIMKCPECHSRIDIKNIAFYNCYFNEYGKKVQENQIVSFGKKIEDFKNVQIFDNKYIRINGENYEIKKTNKGKYITFDISKSDITYIELVFQIKKF